MASRSNAFIAGYRAGILAPSANCSPSQAQHDDWFFTWSVFMQGWRAGQNASEDQICRFHSGGCGDDGENCNISSGRRGEV
jgi:ribosome modulation factor